MELEKLLSEVQNLQTISRWFAYITAIITPIGVIGGLILSHKIEIKQERINDIYKSINATSGKFELLSDKMQNESKVVSTDDTGNATILIKFGGWTYGIQKKLLVSGAEIPLDRFDVRLDPKTRQPLAYNNPLTLKLKDNKVLVTATVTSIDGKIVAKIIDNEWQTPKSGNYFDRNFDINGFEIKDSYDVIVLQVSSKGNIM